MAKLTVKTVEALKLPGRYGDGGGLWLQVAKTGTKSWLLRFMIDGRARAFGLGPVDLVSLADARERARTARRGLLDGIDPIEARRSQRAQRLLDAATAVTFEQAAERYIAAHEAGWRGSKSAKQWRASLGTYTYPHIGSLPVAAIDTPLVLKVIEPMWGNRRETASRVRGRIESILDWAAVRGYRKGGDNPARWKGHLAKLLAAKVRQVSHHAALPYADAPQFMRELRTTVGIAARALEFLILTATRVGETTKATWDEINFDAKLWTVPASRMKAGKEHRVPLSDRAIEILKAIPRARSNYIFIGTRSGTHLRGTAMLTLTHELRPATLCTPHGFRSSFRDWAAEQTTFANHVVEMSLAHNVGAIEGAYRRGDLIDKRRDLMDQRNNYITQVRF